MVEGFIPVGLLSIALSLVGISETKVTFGVKRSEDFYAEILDSATRMSNSRD